MNRKYCVVPKCFNSNVKTPEKMFFSIPKNPLIRKKWLNAIRRQDSIGPKTSACCCEDHFDMEKDMNNYVKHNLVGERLKLKNDVVPHKFACQNKLVEPPERLVTAKVKLAKLKTKLLEDLTENVASTSHDIEQLYIVDPIATTTDGTRSTKKHIQKNEMKKQKNESSTQCEEKSLISKQSFSDYDIHGTDVTDIAANYLEKDVSNYTQYKLGYSQHTVMAKGVVPTKFGCQEDNRKRLGDAIASTVIAKRPKTGQSQESDDDNISTIDKNNSDVQNDDLEITDSVSEYLYSDDDLSSVSSDLDSPATMKVCRICLAMNVKMYHISENNLSAMYEIITSSKIKIDDKLPRMLCWECVSRLSSCKNFIEKAQKTQWILKNLNQEDRLITINDVKSINKDENGLNSTLSTKVYNVNNANLHVIEEIVEIDNKNAETQTVENVTFIKTENSDEEDEIHNIHNQEANMNIEEEEYLEDEIKTEEDVIEEQVTCGVGIDPLKSEQVDDGDVESITNQKPTVNIEKEQYIEDEIKIEEDGIEEPVSCGVGIDPVKSEYLGESYEESITNQDANVNIEKEKYIEDEIKIEEDGIEEPVSCGIGIDPVKSEHLDESDEESITNQDANVNIEKEQYIEDEIKIEEDGVEEPVSCGVGIDSVKSEHLDESDEESITNQDANVNIEKEQYIEDEINIEEDGIEEPVSFGVGIDPVKSEHPDESDEESITNQDANVNIEKEQYIEDEINIEEDGIEEPVSFGVGIDPVKSEYLGESYEESITNQDANVNIEKEQYIEDEIKIEEDGILELVSCEVGKHLVKSEQLNNGDEELIPIEKVALKHVIPSECETDSEVAQNNYRLRDNIVTTGTDECIRVYKKYPQS